MNLSPFGIKTSTKSLDLDFSRIGADRKSGAVLAAAISIIQCWQTGESSVMNRAGCSTLNHAAREHCRWRISSTSLTPLTIGWISSARLEITLISQGMSSRNLNLIRDPFPDVVVSGMHLDWGTDQSGIAGA